MIRLSLLTTFLLCSNSFRTAAQVQASIYTGTGYTYASTTKTYNSNEFALGPHIALLLDIPVAKHIGIEMGISYTIKGFVNKDTLWDDDLEGYWTYRIGNQLGYLGFPLVLTYRFDIGRHHALYAGAGMIYGFMIHGKTKGEWHIYRRGRFLDEGEFTLPVEPRLMPSNDNNGSQVYIFDTGFKLQCTYIWRERLGIRLFHEQSLYSYHTPGVSQSETRLRYTGIALSYSIPPLW